MTWTYNSTDDITIPLSIYYIEVGPRGEQTPTEIWNGVNITMETFNIQTDFGVAASYMIRVIHGQEWYASGRFDLSLTGA